MKNESPKVGERPRVGERRKGMREVGYRGQNRRGLVSIDRFAKLSNCVTNNVIGNAKNSRIISVTKLLVSHKAKL